MAFAFEKSQQLISLYRGASRCIDRQIDGLDIRCKQIAVRIVNVFGGGVLFNASNGVAVGIHEVHIAAFRLMVGLAWHPVNFIRAIPVNGLLLIHATFDVAGK